ncbi:MAG: DMT family transporter [Saprospiraceae bacterium]
MQTSLIINQPSTTFFTPAVWQMLLAVTLFAAMNLCVKAMPQVPAMEIVFFRCVVSLTLSYFWLKKLGVNWIGKKKIDGCSLGGVFLGVWHLFFFFLTIQKIPIATAVTLNYLSPIFAAIIAMLFLGEKMKPIQWSFFAISFIGAALLKGFDDRVSWLYLGMGVLGALLAGVAYSFVRSLSGKEHPLVIVFYFQIIGVLLGGTFSVADFYIPNAMEWLLLLLVGLTAHFAQVQLTKAIQGERVGIITSLVYVGAIYASVFGWILFGEVVTWGNVLSMGLIITGVLLNIWQNKKNS